MKYLVVILFIICSNSRLQSLNKNELTQRDTIVDEEEFLYQEFLKSERKCDSIRDLNSKNFQNRNLTLRNIIKNKDSKDFPENTRFLSNLLNFIENKGGSTPLFAVYKNALVTRGALTKESELKKYKSQIDSLHSGSKEIAFSNLNDSSFEIYLYAFQNYSKSLVGRINFQYSVMCGEVYLSYPFKNDTTTYQIASRFPISLSYSDFSKTNELLLNSYKLSNQCLYPYNRTNQWKAFAKVKGYTNLFFCYSVKDQLNHKALIYIDDQNQVHQLWVDSKYDGNC